MTLEHYAAMQSMPNGVFDRFHKLDHLAKKTKTRKATSQVSFENDLKILKELLQRPCESPDPTHPEAVCKIFFEKINRAVLSEKYDKLYRLYSAVNEAGSSQTREEWTQDLMNRYTRVMYIVNNAC